VYHKQLNKPKKRKYKIEDFFKKQSINIYIYTHMNTHLYKYKYIYLYTYEHSSI
jgi:hypothetical protein